MTAACTSRKAAQRTARRQISAGRVLTVKQVVTSCSEKMTIERTEKIILRSTRCHGRVFGDIALNPEPGHNRRRASAGRVAPLVRTGDTSFCRIVVIKAAMKASDRTQPWTKAIATE